MRLRALPLQRISASPYLSAAVRAHTPLRPRQSGNLSGSDLGGRRSALCVEFYKSDRPQVTKVHCEAYSRRRQISCLKPSDQDTRPCRSRKISTRSFRRLRETDIPRSYMPMLMAASGFGTPGPRLCMAIWRQKLWANELI